MLTPAIFNDLNKKDQADLLQFEGSYQYTRQDAEFIIDLYEMEGFYVEVYFHKEHDELILIKSFYLNAKSQDKEPGLPGPAIVRQSDYRLPNRRSA